MEILQLLIDTFFHLIKIIFFGFYINIWWQNGGSMGILIHSLRFGVEGLTPKRPLIPKGTNRFWAVSLDYI
jgi:hypothetical protein